MLLLCSARYDASSGLLRGGGLAAYFWGADWQACHNKQQRADKKYNFSSKKMDDCLTVVNTIIPYKLNCYKNSKPDIQTYAASVQEKEKAL